ncbi:ergot alkaloid biosynthesis protein [Zooshikella sp. RANM57]|uniref:ergot alkaloid biosynthesis protein n=1 Tax=Zooshikella sp. RANM57 TaxID=3425863 RepID=UPI003D6ECA9E
MNTVLITGGTGKTGRSIASKLSTANVNVRVASRSGGSVVNCESTRFDWKIPSTFDSALKDVSAIYLVAPTNVTEQLTAMQPLIDCAIEKGVSRFVLLSASSVPKGGPMMGEVHAYLEKSVDEWAVLRPTWFMQNFSEQQHLPTIRNEGCIYSATCNGRVPFIDVDDIAKVAVEALLCRNPLNRDLILTGPQPISYDEVAQTISSVIGKAVEHVKITEQQLAERFVQSGMEPHYAQILAAMDTAVAEGVENRISLEVQELTNSEPVNFRYFAEKNRRTWTE